MKKHKHIILAETSGQICFGQDYKNSHRLIIQGNNEVSEQLIPKKWCSDFTVKDGDMCNKNDILAWNVSWDALSESEKAYNLLLTGV